MSIVHWFAQISSGNNEVVQIPEGLNLHLTQVTLQGPADGVTTFQIETSSPPDTDGDDEVMNEGPYSFAHLVWGKVDTQSLDMWFSQSYQVTFSAEGKGVLNLAGYLQTTDEDADAEDYEACMEMDQDEEDEEDDDIVPVPSSKRRAIEVEDVPSSHKKSFKAADGVKEKFHQKDHKPQQKDHKSQHKDNKSQHNKSQNQKQKGHFQKKN